MALTRAQIINQGLSLAGRPDLTSDARLWLNLFLEEQYMNQDFDWLVKTVTSQPVSDGLDFPVDYRAAKSAVLYSKTGSSQEILVLNNQSEYNYRKVGSQTANQSAPSWIFADHGQKKFFFVPGSSTSFTWSLSYYFMPALPDPTDPAQDLLTPVWGLPFQILIDHIKAMAFEYNDDARTDNAKMAVMQKIAQGKMNDHDRRATKSKISMGKSFRKRFN